LLGEDFFLSLDVLLWRSFWYNLDVTFFAELLKDFLDELVEISAGGGLTARGGAETSELLGGDLGRFLYLSASYNLEVIFCAVLLKLSEGLSEMLAGGLAARDVSVTSSGDLARLGFSVSYNLEVIFCAVVLRDFEGLTALFAAELSGRISS